MVCEAEAPGSRRAPRAHGVHQHDVPGLGDDVEQIEAKLRRKLDAYVGG
jgi:hypothetical protein